MVGFLPDDQATPASLVSDQSPLLAEEDVTIVLAEGWVGLPLEGGWVLLLILEGGRVSLFIRSLQELDLESKG